MVSTSSPRFDWSGRVACVPESCQEMLQAIWPPRKAPRPCGAGADEGARLALGRADSVDILEDPAAAGIRSSTPGRALSRGGDGILVMFQAATLSDGDSAAEPFLRVSAPDVQEDARMPAPSVHAVTPLVDAARRAHALRGGAAPRTPWLPPLPDLVHPVSEPSIPAHDPAPRATIGLVDEPEHQQVSPLVWTPGDGSWLLSGRPGSGRTTALRTLVLCRPTACTSTSSTRAPRSQTSRPSLTWEHASHRRVGAASPP